MKNKEKSKLKLTACILLGVLGIILFSLGISSFVFKLVEDYSFLVKIMFLLLGILLISFSTRNSFNNIVEVAKKTSSEIKISRSDVDSIMHKQRTLLRGPKVVVVGGGTGVSVLLRGLKEYTANITAIITVADDGGGSGTLREDLNMLPPGDIRACILALANTEPNMEKLLQYRFDEGILEGQNFGNLFLAAMNGIYGSFEMAVRETSNVLAVTGKVLPMTLEDLVLCARLENGDIIKGESNITLKNMESYSKIEEMYMEPEKSYPLIEAVDAMKEADIIVLGPGSLYTSVIPNLLVNNIVEAIYESKASKVYITNIMTQPGETNDYTVLDHVEAITKHSREDLLDYVIANLEEIPEDTLENYIFDGSRPVILGKHDEEILNSKGIELIKDDLIDIKKHYIRHNSLKLSEKIVELAKK